MTAKPSQSPGPKRSTIATLRAFARAYVVEPRLAPGLRGYVVN